MQNHFVNCNVLNRHEFPSSPLNTHTTASSSVHVCLTKNHPATDPSPTWFNTPQRNPLQQAQVSATSALALSGQPQTRLSGGWASEGLWLPFCTYPLLHWCRPVGTGLQSEGVGYGVRLHQLPARRNWVTHQTWRDGMVEGLAHGCEITRCMDHTELLGPY